MHTQKGTCLTLELEKIFTIVGFTTVGQIHTHTYVKGKGKLNNKLYFALEAILFQ